MIEFCRFVITLMMTLFGVVTPINPAVNAIPTHAVDIAQSVDYVVPFTAQAPLGEWKDTRFQDGCEEATALMIHCVRKTSGCLVHANVIDPNFARQQIIAATVGVDTNAYDTAELILKKRFEINNVQIIEVGKWEDVLNQLQQNKLIITPMDGQKLKNPYFTMPGPERHMVLVKGYDAKSKQFITNDPGTRHGANYKYPVDTFFSAIRDYPSGDHVPIGEVKKRMIVVGLNDIL